MSRHRAIRNININDELDDDALSDAGEDSLTPAQRAQLESGVRAVREILGSEEDSGFQDDAIKNALWEFYFDVQKSVQWLLDERERKNVAKERRDPRPSQDDDDDYFSPTSFHHHFREQQGIMDSRPRVPLIVLAQQRQQMQTQLENQEPVSSTPSPLPATWRALSTITELTERTEVPSNFQANQHLLDQRTLRPQSATSTITSYGKVLSERERQKAQNLAQKKLAGSLSTSTSRSASPSTKAAKLAPPKKSGTSTPIKLLAGADQRQLDMSGLRIESRDEGTSRGTETPPLMNLAREKVLEEAMKSLKVEEESGKMGISLVVIGHVDAGKSTLMGRLLYETGRMDEKTRVANERGSSRIGKASFSWAWELDGILEERQRGVTMDIGQQQLSTPHRQVTILDAPGHRDFIPNMISGASQADCAILVVDAAVGEFEAGFDRGGQTREHLLLIRSLGVSQLIVAVNKLDQAQWEKDRYEEICSALKPFLQQSGFHSSKTKFVPVAASLGVNLVCRQTPDATMLNRWYQGPTLIELLDVLEPPTRDILAPLRLPISNVFKGAGSGTGVSGRIVRGVVQVGERVRILPGDETAIVKRIEKGENDVPWAAAGSNVSLFLTAVDPIHLAIGNVLCPPTDPVPVVTAFTARIIVFDIQVPVMAGTSIELFHHSRDVPATVAKLISILDRTTGAVIKPNPRVLTKGSSAEVQIMLRGNGGAGTISAVRSLPLEPFSLNKEMGRVLIRRAGETIAAGIVLEVVP